MEIATRFLMSYYIFEDLRSLELYLSHLYRIDYLPFVQGTLE